MEMGNKNISKVITDIVETIKEKYAPDKIVLYGSYANGNPTKESDIDILIIKETNERPIDRRIHVRHLVNIRDTISFSPVVFTPREAEYLLSIGDGFLKEIMTKGKVLYG